MNELPIPAGAGINEEQVTSSAPMVRALVVARLEMIWRAVEPHIDLDPDEGGKPDPRFIEAGIRVTDRLATLYRLHAPQVGANEPEEATLTDQRAAVAAQVRSLAQRMGQEG